MYVLRGSWYQIKKHYCQDFYKNITYEQFEKIKKQNALQ